MTLRTGRKSEQRGGDAFTLIELILVMTLLMVVVGISLPSLKNFFHGRTIDSEARRFESLTRYGGSRAVSEGMPMLLWIDAHRKMYGLRLQPGYLDDDPKAVQYSLDEKLEMDTRLPSQTTLTSRWKPFVPGIGNVPMIRFMPDGSIAESSPDRIFFKQDNGETLWVVENTNRLAYAIQTDINAPARR